MTVSTVNREGQVTIPKEIREKLGFCEISGMRIAGTLGIFLAHYRDLHLFWFRAQREGKVE